MQLMDQDQRGGLTTLTLILHQWCSIGGLMFRYLVFFSNKTSSSVQLGYMYLQGRINVLIRVQFYCMKKRMGV